MRRTENTLPEISIVVPSYNEQDNIKILFNKIKVELKDFTFEIIYVDDGSSDYTLRNIKKLADKSKSVKYLSFSRNFGHQAALRAGLSFAKGDAVISMDADLQHPPELLRVLIEKWKQGYGVVYTVRKDHEDATIFKRSSSKGFYKVMNMVSDLNMDEGAADFRLLDRKVVEVLNAHKESDLFLRGYISWIGFRQIGVPYSPAKRFSGQSKYTLRKMINFAVHGITQFSIKPLRASITIGIIFASLGAVYGVYALVSYFVAGGNTALGWTSLIIVVLITSGVQMVVLGIVGEYVGKTFLQTKNRPDYLVAESNIPLE